MFARERLAERKGETTPSRAGSDPDSEQSNLDHAYQSFRSAILSLRIAPGSVVSQVKLAEQLGVSRTPLREAIRLLQREGLVTSEHNKRICVAETSLSDMEQLYAARIPLEAVAIRISVPQMTNEDLSEQAALLDVMDNFRTPETLDAWEKSHRRFHLNLVKYAGERTIRTLSEMTDHAERYRRAFVAQGNEGWKLSAEEHRAIFSAAKARDDRAASVALARHLARTSLSIFLSRAPDHEPRMIRQALKVVQSQE
jgi:DNA-binding GntR family transcriptional regulator